MLKAKSISPVSPMAYFFLAFDFVPLPALPPAFGSPPFAASVGGGVGVRMIGAVAGPGRGVVAAEGVAGGVVIVPGVPGVAASLVAGLVPVAAGGITVTGGVSAFLNGSSHTCSA